MITACPTAYPSAATSTPSDSLLTMISLPMLRNRDEGSASLRYGYSASTCALSITEQRSLLSEVLLEAILLTEESHTMNFDIQDSRGQPQPLFHRQRKHINRSNCAGKPAPQ